MEAEAAGLIQIEPGYKVRIVSIPFLEAMRGYARRSGVKENVIILAGERWSSLLALLPPERLEVLARQVRDKIAPHQWATPEAWQDLDS